MSEVYGSGYGSAHDWRRTSKKPAKVDAYRCHRCGAHFECGVFDNIWNAIRNTGIGETCSRPALEVRRAA